MWRMKLHRHGADAGVMVKGRKTLREQRRGFGSIVNRAASDLALSSTPRCSRARRAQAYPAVPRDRPEKSISWSARACLLCSSTRVPDTNRETAHGWAPQGAMGTLVRRLCRCSISDYSVVTFSAATFGTCWTNAVSRIFPENAVNIFRKRRFRSTQPSRLRLLGYHSHVEPPSLENVLSLDSSGRRRAPSRPRVQTFGHFVAGLTWVSKLASFSA